MPMVGSALSAALKPVIIAEIKNNYTIPAPLGDAELAKFAQALADAIGPTVVAFIQTNAVVTSTVVVTSVAGVTSGPSVSGPGTGTATGTIA